jgi:hypothetical protein
MSGVAGVKDETVTASTLTSTPVSTLTAAAASAQMNKCLHALVCCASDLEVVRHVLLWRSWQHSVAQVHDMAHTLGLGALDGVHYTSLNHILAAKQNSRVHVALRVKTPAKVYICDTLKP